MVTAEATLEPDTRRKAGAGEDGRVREPAAPVADPGVGGGVEIARHARHRAEVAHQHEQRDDGEVVDRGVGVGIGAERRERRPAAVEHAEADDADEQHGDADRHAQRHQTEQRRDADQADRCHRAIIGRIPGFAAAATGRSA